VKLVVFFERQMRIVNQSLEHCAESKLRSTNEKMAF
jgi:hypothetical protein